MKVEAPRGPLEEFLEQRSAGKRPIPLKATSYAIDIRSGLAVVRLDRKFRNDEERPIEATITFPVPFDAVVFRIEAKINGRLLTGKAQAKTVARASYETAIDEGKPAVLHEELLRGLHMLSVANVAPGAEIEVAATFSVPVSLAGGDGRFRIPVTVGQIYGELPLLESDALLTGGPVQNAAVEVTADHGTVRVNGATPVGGKLFVPLDRPIEVEVFGLYQEAPTRLEGRAADGRNVTMTFTPMIAAATVLDIDVVLDVSGSMQGRISSGPESGMTKWDAVKHGLATASHGVLEATDKATVWTFANDCRRHGQTSGDALANLVFGLPFISGGTELGSAVAMVVASRRETNVLLVTDGKSGRPIDIQAALASGARFTVVLVGEDALEVSVGYLAALTGGQMFVVQGADVAKAIAAALDAMRRVGAPVEKVEGIPTNVSRVVAGTAIEASWHGEATAPAEREKFAAAVAAYAAQLAIQGMDEGEGAKFAEAEGIVSHLTSIVLVDDAAEAVQGIPEMRKVPLASPATSGLAEARSLSMRRASSPAPRPEAGGHLGASFDDVFSLAAPRARAAPPMSPPPAGALSPPGSAMPGSFEAPGGGAKIEWDHNPTALANGDVSGQLSLVRLMVATVSSLPEIVALATSLGISAAAVAVALLAELDAGRSRTAARIARLAFRKADRRLLEAARKALGGQFPTVSGGR